MKKLFLLLPLSLMISTSINARTQSKNQAERTSPSERRWYKGNTHTHTLNSDGDSPPGTVAHWYRDHGYDFLVLSDHNYLTRIDALELEIERENERAGRKPFLLIPGEEVSSQYIHEDRRYVIHVNGIGTEETVGEQKEEGVRKLMQTVVDQIHAKGGFPHLNHPNFYWSVTPDDIYSVKKLRHFEIYNGHPKVHNLGGSGHPGLEEIWDDLLGRGRIYFGVAVDDAHNFKKWSRELSNPGRGWVVVRAPELTSRAIIAAMKEGDFYASTGVVLEDISTADQTLTLKIVKRNPPTPEKIFNNAFGSRTEFIGQSGRILKRDDSLEPSYRLNPEDLYVRARVRASDGSHAWTQPLFAEGKGVFE